MAHPGCLPGGRTRGAERFLNLPCRLGISDTTTVTTPWPEFLYRQAELRRSDPSTMFLKSLRNASRRTPPASAANLAYSSRPPNTGIRTLELLANVEQLDEDMDSDTMSVDSASSRNASSSATSHDDDGNGDASTRSGSPAPSMYSMTDSIRASSYRHEYGRSVNNHSDVYLLPADEEELQRLGMRDFAVRWVRSGLWPARRPRTRPVPASYGQVSSPNAHGTRGGYLSRAKACTRPRLWEWQLVCARDPSVSPGLFLT